MSVSIVERLKSAPTSVRVGQEAVLKLVLQSSSSEGEKVDVEYRLNPGNDYFFGENDGKLILGTFDVGAEPTVAERKYALKGPAGRVVQITAIVLPERIDQSKEAVAVLK